MFKSLALFVVGVAALAAPADHWAILVSGSSGYGNYRHHADTCHAYHLLIAGGISPSRVITFLYDDVAQDASNPFPEQLFNAPTPDGTPGVDVYAGCKKSYTGDAVTASNFLAVLTGNASGVSGGSGEVLRSGPNSHVFFAFFDHGAQGLLAFPTGSYLYKPDLDAALQTASSANMWARFTIYVEACESGSMFEGYPTDKGVYITTAANADESSWGTYCPPDDSVNGKDLGTCLGDLYSVSWLEDAQKAGNLQSESLEAQYGVIKAETNLSHVMQYGEQDWTEEPIGSFMGNVTSSASSKPASPVQYSRRRLAGPSTPHPPSAWDSRLATLTSLHVRAARTPSHTPLGASLRAQLRAETAKAARWDAVFHRAATTYLGAESAEAVLARPAPHLAAWSEEQWACYRGGIEGGEEACGMTLGDYGLRYGKVVAIACDAAKSGQDSAAVRRTLVDACAATQ